MFVTLALFALAADRPVPPGQAAARFTLPPGFSATLFAGEPDIAQPIAMTFDDRGRLWVVENFSYPKWSKDGKGRDRVVILEDADGDGKFDKKTVFLDDGVNLSGIELGHGGVWLCSTPNLLFVPVNPGEDKPAGPAKVVLDGWSLDCKHNVFSSLIWGPDGWLYGCNGIIATSHVGKPGTPPDKRTAMNCGVWRVHPATHVFERVCQGTTNPFGLDFDDFGEMFFTNCVIGHLWHAVPGAHFQRMYGQDLTPNTYELMRETSDHFHWAGGHWTAARGGAEHSDAGGGHSHAGCLVYLGDQFPAEYRNSVFMGNIHGNRLNRDSLVRPKDGLYVGKRAPDFLFANDPWFRPVAVKSGPTGSLFVADWTDTGECHNYDRVDQSNGRVYEVRYGKPKPWKGDLSKLPDAELVKLQLHKNDWFCRHARRLLHERALARPLNAGTVPALKDILAKNPDETRKLRALWALHCAEAATAGDLENALRDPSLAVQAWAVRLLCEPGDLTPAAAMLLGARFERQQAPLVRLHIASGAQRLTPAARAALASSLLNPADTDPNLALMVWYAVQPVGLADPTAALELIRGAWASKAQTLLVRQHLGRAGAEAQAREEVVALLPKGSNALQRDVLAGLLMDLADRRDPKPPANWPAAARALAASKSAKVRDLAEEVALRFRDPRVIETLQARLADQAAPAPERVKAAERLIAQRLSDLAPTLRKLLADPALRGVAVRGLAGYADAETPAAILAHYANFTPTEKADAVLTLSARPAYAEALVEALRTGAVPKGDVSAFAARQIQALNKPPLTAKFEAAWGTLKPTSAAKAAQKARYRADLAPDRLAAASPARGRALFATSCAACHKLFGEGGDVGPELTGSQRANLDYILENVLDPNAVVPSDYKMTAFYLADGRVVTGLVRGETSTAVTVRTANDTVILQKPEIEERKKTDQSVMPEGLLDAMTPQQVRDLVAYLASPGQVALPK